MKGKVLFIQLTRTGDLVQTLQAVRQFKAENEGIKCNIITRKKFAKGIEFLLYTVFENIFYIDTKELLTEGTFSSGVKNISNFMKEVNSEKYDVSINFSFNKSASYLHSLVSSSQKIGMQRNSQAEISISDPWSQFVFSNVMKSNLNPFNLVDIFRYTMGCKETHILQPDENPSVRSKNIVIHPFASSQKKRWGASRWIETILCLSKNHSNHTFHIVGGPQDESDVQKITNSPALAKLGERLHSHVGRGTIKDTYQLLQNSQLFIGHDSLVSHLAAETMTPSIVLSLGTVRPHETTAYNERLINLIPKNSCFPCTPEKSCELLPCHNSIHHQVVARCADFYLSDTDQPLKMYINGLSPFHLINTRVMQASYNDQGIALTDVMNDYSSESDVFRNYYKIIFQFYLRAHDVKSDLPDISDETAAKIHYYTEGTNHLYELYNFGVKYCNQIIKKSEQKDFNMGMIKDDLTKLTEIDQLCQVTKQNYPLLGGIIDFFFVNKANTAGNNLTEIIKSNLLCYYDASNLIAVVSEFIEKSVTIKNTVTESIKEV